MANVRLGSSIRQLFAFDSPLQSELVDLGRGNVPLSFMLNLVPCVIDTALKVRVDTLSVFPQRGLQEQLQVPSQAAPARWNRRLAPVHPDRVWELDRGNAALYTVFDSFHRQRTFQRDELDEVDTLIAKAISVTPEISHAEGFLLLHGVAELPSPQIVLKSKDIDACVVPLLYKLHPVTVCTIEVPLRASSFEVAYLAARACAPLKGAHYQIARRTATIVGHHGTVDPFKAGAVLTHEALVSRGFIPSSARHWDPAEDFHPPDLSRILVFVARDGSCACHTDSQPAVDS